MEGHLLLPGPWRYSSLRLQCPGVLQQASGCRRPWTHLCIQYTSSASLSLLHEEEALGVTENDNTLEMEAAKHLSQECCHRVPSWWLLQGCGFYSLGITHLGVWGPSPLLSEWLCDYPFPIHLVSQRKAISPQTLSSKIQPHSSPS